MLPPHLVCLSMSLWILLVLDGVMGSPCAIKTRKKEVTACFPGLKLCRKRKQTNSAFLSDSSLVLSFFLSLFFLAFFFQLSFPQGSSSVGSIEVKCYVEVWIELLGLMMMMMRRRRKKKKKKKKKNKKKNKDKKK